jgi:undecaprenyl diphosphate synthase
MRSTLHVILIPDGNGRWAQARGFRRSLGHRAGADAVVRVIEAAPILGIETLTLFAFSSDNWRRPAREVSGILAAVRGFLRRESDRLAARSIRLTVIGRRDRLPRSLRLAIERAEAATRQGERLHVRLAVDYSGREAIARAAVRSTVPTCEAFARELATAETGGWFGPPVPDVDLVVRTGGEQRLSDCLLWESAYAELVFSSVPWPEFGAAELARALTEFRGRERRFGGLPEADAASATGG